MAKSEFILSIGDDNVVLTRLADGKVANAWLGSPDPAMATEELGEALAEDTKCKISVLIDTLDQTFREEEIPKVGVLDRRRVLGRHVNMAFPGANLRGAHLVDLTLNKTLLYQFAAVPLEGRLLGWIEYVDSLPNEKGGFYAVAVENVDIIQALAPQEDGAPQEEQQTASIKSFLKGKKAKDGKESKEEKEEVVAPKGNRWRHLIGINATGGLRQIIEKNGRLSLTRLTQAPPPDTAPDEFADMISRDFKATITYIRRLGYAVGESLDLVILTTQENKAALDALNWEGARSVSIYTPSEAAAALGLGSIGREDQAFCDVLHAAFFASKPKTAMPLSRAATIGDIKDDIRELAFMVAPFAAGILLAALIGWTTWTGYDFYTVSTENDQLNAQLSQLKHSLAMEQSDLGKLPYPAAMMRNIIGVSDAMQAGQTDIAPILRSIASALQGDAVVLTFNFGSGSALATTTGARVGNGGYVVNIRMRLADVIVKAEEAVQISRKLLQRVTDAFGKGYKVEMVAEPAATQSGSSVTGNLLGGPTESSNGAQPGSSKEYFYTEFKITKGGS